MEFTAEKWEVLPLKLRVVAKIGVDDVEHVDIHGTNGESAWMKVDDEDARELSEELRASMRGGLYTRYAMTLVPLLEDGGITLKPLGESVFAKRPVVGIKVVAPGKDEVEFFFDKESNLLTRCVSRETDARGAETVFDEHLHDYRDFDGLKYPSRWVAYIDGEKFQERTVVELKLLKKIDATLFQRP